ncbi:hypothetical protein [Endozoicomonas sp. 8E]|uniref:hypothetical protein n=1 Tax=Endozoicomonas sp. 8E TaxID=3035692 RepID=UPI002938EDB0|nr:hypothetical protein [Endozoicomonas sp. 8E]WOG28833.1 hypothetical protein P6910_04005 [Endozoicomonas sp. 8E]
MTHHQNHTARCPPSLVIPEKAETHCWPWIPAFAGMTTSEHGNELTPVIPGFILVIPGFILVIPAKAGIHTDSPPKPYCPVPPLALLSPRRQRPTVGPGFPPSRE